MKILIIKLSAIGDVLHALPALEAIKKEAPGAFIGWLVDEKAADVLRYHPLIDRLYILPSKRWLKNGNFIHSYPQLKGFFQTVRKEGFDVGIDMQGLLKSAVCSYLSGSRLRIGFHKDDCREQLSAFLHHKHSALSYREKHVILRNLSPLAELFSGFTPSFDIPYRLYLPDKSRVMPQQWLEKHRLEPCSYYLINPGGGWETKQYPAELYSAVADEVLHRYNLKGVLLWGPGEKHLAEAVHALAPVSTLLSPPTRLLEMAALQEDALFFLGPETGPLHIADALHIPSVVLYGPSDIEKNRPVCSESVAVMPDIECGGCYMRKCSLLTCHEMMTPHLVLKGTEKLITTLRNKKEKTQ